MAEMNHLEGRKLICSLLPTLTGHLPQFWPQDLQFLTVAMLDLTSTRTGWERWLILPPHQVRGQSQQPISCHRQEYIAHWSETWESAEEKHAFFRCWAELTYPIHAPTQPHVAHWVKRVADNNSMWTLQMLRGTWEQIRKLTLLLYQHLSTLIKPSLRSIRILLNFVWPRLNLLD